MLASELVKALQELMKDTGEDLPIVYPEEVGECCSAFTDYIDVDEVDTVTRSQWNYGKARSNRTSEKVWRVGL